jgi:hypothetical protein
MLHGETPSRAESPHAWLKVHLVTAPWMRGPRIDVLDRAGRIVARPREDEKISLAPGRYVIRCRVPSGAVIERELQLQAGQLASEPLTDPVARDHIAYTTLDTLLPVTTDTAARNPDRASAFEHATHVTQGGAPALEHVVDETARGESPDGWWVDLRIAFAETLTRPASLEVTAPGCGPQTTTLPIHKHREDGQPTACLVRIVRMRDELHLATTPATGVSSLLAAYLSHNAVLEAAAVGRRLNRERSGVEVPTAEGACPHRTAGNVAAALAGYAFIAIGDLAELDRWPYAFAHDTPDLADSAIVAGATAWLHDDQATATCWFTEARARGEPMFEQGRALLIASTRVL